MAQGLQLWDANGNILLDVTERLTRVLGTFETGVQNGSIIDDNLIEGTPWFYSYVLSDPNEWTKRPVSITFNQNVISWVFDPPRHYQDTAINTQIIYGVY